MNKSGHEEHIGWDVTIQFVHKTKLSNIDISSDLLREIHKYSYTVEIVRVFQWLCENDAVLTEVYIPG